MKNLEHPNTVLILSMTLEPHLFTVVTTKKRAQKQYSFPSSQYQTLTLRITKEKAMIIEQGFES